MMFFGHSQTAADLIYPVEEILSLTDKKSYRICVTNEMANQSDEIHLGYKPLTKLNVHSNSKT